MIGTIICLSAIGAGIGAFGVFVIGSSVSRNGDSGRNSMGDFSDLSNNISEVVKSSENLSNKAGSINSVNNGTSSSIANYKTVLEKSVYDLGNIYKELYNYSSNHAPSSQNRQTANYTAQERQPSSHISPVLQSGQTAYGQQQTLPKLVKKQEKVASVQNVYEQNTINAQPTTVQQPFAQPVTVQQPITQPVTVQQPITQPVTPHQPFAQPTSVQDYNEQISTENQSYQEIPQPVPEVQHLPERIISVTELFERVKQLQNSTPQFRVYNVGTSRLEFSSDPSAQYICDQSDLNQTEYYVLPNQTDFFKTLSLAPDVFKFSVSSVTDQYKIRLAIADGSGNIYEKGEIMRL